MAQEKVGFNEGTTGDKPRATAAATTCPFAFRHLARDGGDMVIFGFSFGSHDSPDTSATKVRTPTAVGRLVLRISGSRPRCRAGRIRASPAV
jgi:hypothetical protein